MIIPDLASMIEEVEEDMIHTCKNCGEHIKKHIKVDEEISLCIPWDGHSSAYFIAKLRVV